MFVCVFSISVLSQILAGIFEKFKEKKQNVVTSLREASDTVFLTVCQDEGLWWGGRVGG